MMKRIMLCLLFVCGTVQAQDVIIVRGSAVVAQPVFIHPVQVTYVPRYFPINRLLFGPYRPVFVHQPLVIVIQENGGK